MCDCILSYLCVVCVCVFVCLCHVSVCVCVSEFMGEAGEKDCSICLFVFSPGFMLRGSLSVSFCSSFR